MEGMVRLAPLIAICAACALSRSGRSSASANGPVGHPIALQARDLSGREVDVAADRGRVRVIDLWATWCEPCRDELPDLDRLSRELGGRGLSVYAVSFDEDRSEIPAFLHEIPVGFPVLWEQGGGSVAAAFQVKGLPTTILVDRQGVVRFIHEGYDERIAAAERREIEELLAEDGPLTPPR